MSESNIAWYYTLNGQKHGPVDGAQLKALAQANKLTGASVWREGMAEWTPAAKIKGLLPATPPTIPTAGPPALGAAGPLAGMDSSGSPHGTGPAKVKRITLWVILMASGAALWLICAFLPWWGITVVAAKIESKTDAEKYKRANEIIKENSDWYHAHLNERIANKLAKTFVESDASKTSTNLLGISTGTGIFALIIALLALGGVVASYFVPVLANWRWAVSLFVGLTALILLILDLIWLFGSPGESALPFLRQGNGIGPAAHLIATLTVLVGSAMDGVFGLFAFLAGMKASKINRQYA